MRGSLIVDRLRHGSTVMGKHSELMLAVRHVDIERVRKLLDRINGTTLTST